MNNNIIHSETRKYGRVDVTQNNVLVQPIFYCKELCLLSTVHLLGFCYLSAFSNALPNLPLTPNKSTCSVLLGIKNM